LPDLAKEFSDIGKGTYLKDTISIDCNSEGRTEEEVGLLVIGRNHPGKCIGFL